MKHVFTSTLCSVLFIVIFGTQLSAQEPGMIIEQGTPHDYDQSMLINGGFLKVGEIGDFKTQLSIDSKGIQSIYSEGGLFGNDLFLNPLGGRVGINLYQDFPLADLDVNGSVNIRNAIFINGDPGINGQVLTSGGGGILSWENISGGDTDWTESGNNVYRSFGNVGIGTTSPTYNLDVDGDINTSGRLLANGIAGTSGQVLTSDASGNISWGNSSGSDTDWTESGNNVFRLSGNIGIGESNPVEKLHITDPSNAGIKLESDFLSYLDFYDGNDKEMSLVYNGTNGTLFTTTPNGKLYLGTNNNVNMSIVPSGNIGIGTFSPNADLHLVGNSFRFEKQNSSTQYIDYYKNGTQLGFIGFNHLDQMYIANATGNNFFFLTGPPSNPRRAILINGIGGVGVAEAVASGFASFASGSFSFASGSGSVALASGAESSGVGSVAIGASSEATGDYTFVSRFRNGYSMYTNQFNNPSTSTGVHLPGGGNFWVSVSNRNRKENFKPLNDKEVFEKISNVNYSSWNYKGQNSKTNRHYGIMSQDFYDLFGNDGVGTIGDDKTVNPIDMIGITMSALKGANQKIERTEINLQEQQVLITEQQKSIEKLQEKLIEMEHKLLSMNEKLIQIQSK